MGIIKGVEPDSTPNNKKTPTPISVWKPLLRNSIVIFILQVPLKFQVGRGYE